MECRFIKYKLRETTIMKYLKKEIVCFFAMFCALVLSSCSSNEYGTKENPAGVGQMMYYDGMEAEKERNRFKAEITLEDVVRGEEAEDIFAAAGGYGDSHARLELDAEEELMVARFTVTLTEAPDDTKIDISERDVNLFSLISQSGTGYEYFQQRTYISGNLFKSFKTGDTQTGALFYVVDKDDKNPEIVFQPSVKEGIWFKTNLDEKEKEKVEKPLLAADWLDADGKTPVYAGTVNTPLPVGEFGYMKCRSTYFGDYEIELRVNDVLRGEEAEEKLYDLRIYSLEALDLLESQEYLMINLTANLPSANLTEEDILFINSFDFGVINSKDGRQYDYDHILYLSPHELDGIAPGGTATGWIGVIVDKADSSPMMYYQSLDNKMLYFKLDKAYDIPDGYASYEPGPIFLKDPIRDTKQKKGSWNNPYNTGDTVELNYNPRRIEKSASPFSANICVKKAYRGELAKEFVDFARYYEPNPGMDLIVLEAAVEITEIDGNNAPEFDANNLEVLTGQGGKVTVTKHYTTFLKTEELGNVYPGGTAEGYIAFLVPKDIENFVITYGDAYYGLDNSAWIALEFSNHIPDDVAAQLVNKEEFDEEPETPEVDLSRYNVGKATLTATWEMNGEMAVMFNASGEDGKILDLATTWYVRYSEQETDLYQDILEEYRDIIPDLQSQGNDIKIEWDDTQQTIIITERMVYGENGIYEIGYMLEEAGVTLSDISDQDQVPNMEKLGELLQTYGFEIEVW